MLRPSADMFAVFALLLLAFCLGPISCAPQQTAGLFQRRPKLAQALQPAAAAPPGGATRFFGQAMGTQIVLMAWTSEGAKAQAAFGAAMAEIDRIERLMTTWPHPDWAPSDIMRVNAAAGGAPVVVDADTFAVLESAQCMARLSCGLFDVTIGALDAVWHFDEDARAEVPEAEALAKAVRRVDYKALQLNKKACSARLAQPGMALNLGGIAKGYAVDRAVDVLHRAGLRDVVVQAGGDLYVSGQRGQSPWRIGIRHPRGQLVDDVLGQVAVRDQAMSTAGDYERSFEVGQRRYHHILDPRSGEPASLCQSVTILAPSAWLADAIDDVVFLKGPQLGLAWIKQFSGVEAVIVDQAGHMFVSEGLAGAVVAADRTGQAGLNL